MTIGKLINRIWIIFMTGWFIFYVIFNITDNDWWNTVALIFGLISWIPMIIDWSISDKTKEIEI